MGLVGVRGWSLTPSLRLRGWATEQLQPKNGKYLLLCSREAFRDRQRQAETERDCMSLVGQSQLCLLRAETKCLLFFLSHGGFGQRVLEELRFPQREESSDSSLLRSKVLIFSVVSLTF